MDIVRERPRRLPKAVLPLLGIVSLVVLAAWAVLELQRMREAPPIADRSTIITDVARKGTLELAVSAQGVFTPERVRVVSAPQDGVIDKIFVKVGSFVRPGTAIACMENPAVKARVVADRSALKVARENLESVRQQQRASVISNETAIADVQATHAQDELQVRTDAELVRQGFLGTLPLASARIEEAKSRNDVVKSRAQLDVAIADARAKIGAAQAQVDGATAQLAEDVAKMGTLSVRAVSSGVVQSVDVDPGTSLAQSAQIIRIADVHDLKAVLQVAETDVPSIAAGMPVRVTDGGGSAVGRIARIAPSAQGGTVAVDVIFSGAPPPGALPSANVDAAIQIATIADATSIARPAGAADNSWVILFRVLDGGSRAVRLRAYLGRGTNERVHVKNGVAPGDTIIVSDMSPYLDKPELRLR
jgi:HlyD family secretion protein